MRTWKTRTAMGAIATALAVGVGGAAATALPAAGAATVHTKKFTATSVAGHRLGRNGFVSSEIERHKGHVIGTDAVTGTFNLRTHTSSCS